MNIIIILFSSSSTIMTPDQGQSGQGTQQGGFIPGPFGGQIPTPPSQTQTQSDLPSFQFSKDDFSPSTTENKEKTMAEEIIDPFANGIASLTTTTSSPTTEDTIIDGEIKQQDGETNKEEDIDTVTSSNTNTEQPIEIVPVELPNTQAEEEENINENNQDTNNQISEDRDNIESNSNEFTLPPVEETTVPSEPEISFDLPSSEDNNITETTEPEVTNIDHTTGQEDFSFELPTSDAADIPVDNNTAVVVEEDKEINKSNSDEEKGDHLTDTEVTDDSGNDSDSTYSDSTESVETPIIQEDTIAAEQEEENNININETEEAITSAGVNESVKEEVYTDDNIYPLTEEYTTFVRELDSLLQFKNSEEVSILAHRTDEDEIQYSFHKDNNTITVKRNYAKFSDNSSEEKLLSFNNDDGLQVSLNEDSIAHYGKGNENEDSDITYYLKDKLNKFIAIITDEKIKEEKKAKEEKQNKKVTIDLLRSF